MKINRTRLTDTPFQGFVMREEFILDHCRGRTVLHLGCIGFQDLPVPERVRRFKDTLHCKLMSCCEVTGVDYSRDAVESVREALGDNEVVCLDVERDLGNFLRKRRFDVILAGDIIEHLSNPGAFLGELRQCGPDATVVLTTPNAFGVRLAMRNLMGRVDDSHEHAYMFSPLVLRNLLYRYGFTDIALFGGMQESVITHSAMGTWCGTMFFRIFPRLAGTLCVLARQGVQR